MKGILVAVQNTQINQYITTRFNEQCKIFSARAQYFQINSPVTTYTTNPVTKIVIVKNSKNKTLSNIKNAEQIIIST